MAESKQFITKNMTIGDVVARYPDAIPVFLEHGMHCIGCHVAASESVEQGAAAHGITGKDFEDFLKHLNKAVKKGKKEV